MDNAEYERYIDFNFHESIEEFPFPEDNIREWIFLCIEQEHKVAGLISFIFCSDDYLHGINLEYLKHDTYTDIITFDYGDEYESISGDLFISIDRVKENAFTQDENVFRELCRVIIHGILHLIGYKDKTPAEINGMRNKENFYLKMLDFL